MNNSFPCRDTRWNKMPAAMRGNTIDFVRAKELMSIFGAFPPSRVISKRRDHFDIVSVALQEFTNRDIVRRDPGDFRRVIDAQNNDPHYSRSER
jgi:hypothetical protein